MAESHIHDKPHLPHLLQVLHLLQLLQALQALHVPIHVPYRSATTGASKALWACRVYGIQPWSTRLALAFAHFSSELLWKEQMIIPAKKKH